MSAIILSSFITGGLGVILGWAIARRYTAKPLRVVPYKPIQGKIKMVFVVRTDLNMGKGKIAAQCSHAAVDCYQIANEEYPHLVQAWELQGQPKIVLKGSSLEELEQLSARADDLGLTNSIIHDAGHTQVAEGTATVLGIGPGLASDIDQVAGHLKLL